jgi:hypothetical protein
MLASSIKQLVPEATLPDSHEISLRSIVWLDCALATSINPDNRLTYRLRSSSMQSIAEDITRYGPLLLWRCAVDASPNFRSPYARSVHLTVLRDIFSDRPSGRNHRLQTLGLYNVHRTSEQSRNISLQLVPLSA